MGPRFALRWTAIGLACAIAIVTAGFVLYSWQRNLPAQTITYEQLLAAAEMPLDAQGRGTQIISGTTLTFQIQPYPPVIGQPVTVTLLALSSMGQPSQTVSPTLYASLPGKTTDREYPLQLQSDHAYTVHGDFFSAPGPWRLRVDVYVGDETPANMLMTVQVR